MRRQAARNQNITQTHAHPHAAAPAPAYPVDGRMRREYVGSLGIDVVPGLTINESDFITLQAAVAQRRAK